MVTTFPGPDRGFSVFPGVDEGLAVFPPFPKAGFADAVTLVDIISTGSVGAAVRAQLETTVDVESAIAVLGGAFATTVVDILSSIDARAGVSATMATVVEIDSTANLGSVGVAALVTELDVLSTIAVVGVVARAELVTGIDIESTGRLVGGVAEMETLVDISSWMDAVASTAVQASTVVDVASSITLTVPTAWADAVTVVDVESTTAVSGVAAVAAAVSAIDVSSTATLVPGIPPFPRSGMDKSGNFSLPRDVWTLIPAWSIRSSYPDTVITANGIEVPAGVEVTISGQVRFAANDSFSGNGMGCRVMAGATMIGAAAGTPGNGNTATLVPFTWKNETGSPVLITMEGFTNSTSFSRNIVQGGVNTYLTLVPVVQLIERAADNFDEGPGGLTGPLSSNWIPTGGGVLTRVNGRIDGTNTPSVPLSYAWWSEDMPSDTQVVRAVVRWDGRDPEHSAMGLVVRADPNQDPVTNPGAQLGVQFSFTRSIMALYYEDYDATNGFVPVTGVAQYVNTTKFPEGAVVELRAEGNLYTARMNGTTMLQGTVENSVIPFSRRTVGLTIQNDELVSGGGGPPGRLDDFQAFTP